MIGSLGQGLRERHHLSLHRSDRAMTDCRPVSLFSIQTAQQLSEELGSNMDKRRFRANIYLDLGTGNGFAENKLVGHTLQIGPKVRVIVVDRDPRCKMITLDPGTAQPNPDVMRHLSRDHEGKAGIYGAVVIEGTVRPGDDVALIH
jgi:uncharacterized protein YcbX